MNMNLAVLEQSCAATTILIVDDTPANLGVVVDSLEEGRFRVLIARDGAEALQRAAFVKPDIILLDVMMPGMDGFEVCRRLKAQESTRDIPVLFMTALTEIRDKLAGFEAGGVDYVTKPVQIDEVMARVNTHINLRNMRRQVESQNLLLRSYRESLEHLVAERTRQLRTIFNTIPELIWVTDAQGCYRVCNPVFEKYFGVAEEVLTGKTDAGLVEPELAAFLRQKDREAMVACDTIAFEVWVSAAGSGRQVLLRVSKTPIFDEQGEIDSVLSIAHDITERKGMEKALRNRNRESSSLIENTPDYVVRFDRECRYMYVNPAFEKMTGAPAAEFVGRTPQEIFAGEVNRCYEKNIHNVVDSRNSIEAEIVGEFSAGMDKRYFHVRYTPEFDSSGRVVSVLAVGRDISPLKEAERRLNHMAMYDELTGLPNRTLFRDRLSLAMASRQGYSIGLLLIDLDNFKAINDTLGHTVGDALLKRVGESIRSLLREEDMVARLGGDEFVVVLQNVSQPDDLDRAAARILRAISTPMIVEGNQLYINASMGISVYPGDGDDYGTMLRNADTAMYYAKSQGRNGYRYFVEDMNKDRQERLSMAAGIRHALDNGEFELNYQPKVSLKAGEICGMEALIRWRHPQQGMIPPGRFIPVAEDCGLISEIGEWVIAAAIRQLAAWRDMGLTPVKVAVNLSAGQCQSEQTLLLVDRLLAEYAIDGKYLEMEITESMVMHDAEKAIDIFWQLKERGVSVAIDDFGTGHSSLSYLKRFPIDSLKIDKSFVDDIGTDKNDAEIVCAIIALAHSLGMCVVAEGVETKAQLDFLRNNGCDEVQGYYFSKPLPAGAMTECIKHGRFDVGEWSDWKLGGA
ncbi:MAG TPA: EAL domain-containing protein [Gallionella sp.]|nr:EAL domain-containing protein [Gallionella sp.]